MKFNSKKIVLSSLAVAALAFTGCGGSSSTTAAAPAASNCSSVVVDVPLTGDIGTMTLDKTKVYGLDGKVRLTAGSTLTIPAGTKIAGCTPASYLLIKPTAQIVANGTMAEPITFTSQLDLQGLSQAGNVGEWGGLILLGNAYVDHGVTQYEAGDAEDTFGSTDHTHDTESSGTLNYVLVKHTGFRVNLDKELNGLSMGGVGSGTTVTNVAIVGGADDGMEIWGGTVNLTNLYVTNAADDSVDTDLGYRGTISNVYVKQNKVDSINNHDSAAIETGNDSNDLNVTDADATQPTITNFTAVVKGAGIYMKNDAGLKLTNAQFTSVKTVDQQLVTYRTSDIAATNAMHVTSTCFQNGVTAGATTDYYASTNTKDANAATAHADWTTNANITAVINSTSCTGANLATIWKGTAGSNAELE